MKSSDRTKQGKDLKLTSWLSAIAPTAKTTCPMLSSIFPNRIVGNMREGATNTHVRLAYPLLLTHNIYGRRECVVKWLSELIRWNIGDCLMNFGHFFPLDKGK